MNWGKQICTLNLSGFATPLRSSLSPTHQRLLRGFSRLRDIESARAHRGNALFGKFAEDRIVWRELLDLELQDVDEQSERILAAAEDRSACQGG